MPIRQKLVETYPMLSTTVANVADYVEPDDYGRLLKPYGLKEKADLGIFQEFVREVVASREELARVLELGCGPGRSTQAFLDTASTPDLRLLDLSSRMLAFSKKRFSGNPNVNFIESDTITYLESSDERYDLIYSLWSFSHSVHQILINSGLEEGRERVKAALKRTVSEMMKPGAGFFVIHVDSKSDEQTILFRQWAKLFPIFKDEEHQTPSKQIFDDVLGDLQREGVIDLEVDHLELAAIEYESIGELLDVFLNFHLESHFNDDENVETVIREIEEYAQQFKTSEGKYSIKPGCFLYKVIKKDITGMR